ncbi:MAG: hypothetical protein JNL93_02880 [Pelomonas sp.]|nr:hypothetical protein [Roseateles sp.]
MSLHRLAVSTMLAVAVVLALLYVCTLPIAPGLREGMPVPSRLETEAPSAAPIDATRPLPVERVNDAQTLRHLA